MTGERPKVTVAATAPKRGDWPRGPVCARRMPKRPTPHQPRESLAPSCSKMTAKTTVFSILAVLAGSGERHVLRLGGNGAAITEALGKGIPEDTF